MARVAVALSGGVDSSTAFLLLKEAGHDVFGITMRHLPKEFAGERIGSCCAPSSLAGAGRLAARVGVPHYIFDLETSFTDAVMGPSARAYAGGATPNPCVWCNEHVKFDALWRRALALGAEFFATGHYARVAEGVLRRAVDHGRDQSYFLYRVRPDVLSRTLFPLGEFTKDQVRDLARARGLEMSDKPDSMDVCFAPGGDFGAAFRRFAPEALEPGPVVDESGRVLGTHEGIGRVTIGQRRGLGIPTGERVYVRALDPSTRTVVVGERPESSVFAVSDLVLAAGTPDRFDTMVRVRSQHAGEPATIVRDSDGSARVATARPLTGVTPGQSAVFYDGDRVVGGGFIR